MYLGGSLFFLGIALVAGSYWLVVAYIPLFVYFKTYVIPREEAYMSRTYGEAYRTYCRLVGRWL